MADNVVKICEALAARTGRAVSTVSRLTTGSGTTVARLKAGHRITTERAEAAIRMASKIWPEDRQWPAGITRPPLCNDEDAA